MIYRSDEGRRAVHDLYDRAVDRLGLAVEERTLSTRHGETHLLAAGPEEAPPVVVLQGGNSLNPLTLAWYRPLAERFRLLAPDTPGHPGKSVPVRPSWSRGGYGRWLVDVVDGLGLARPPVIGSSHGGAVVLQAASVAPGRIGPAALVVPMGVMIPRLRTLAGLSPAALLQRWSPSDERLRRAAERLFTEPLDALWMEMVRTVADHVRFEKLLPRGLPRGALSGWDAPAVVFASEHDALFPGRRLLARSRRLIPRVEDAVMMEGQRHVPDAETFRAVGRRIGRFFEGAAVGARG